RQQLGEAADEGEEPPEPREPCHRDRRADGLEEGLGERGIDLDGGCFADEVEEFVEEVRPEVRLLPPADAAFDVPLALRARAEALRADAAAEEGAQGEGEEAFGGEGT